MKVLVLVQEYPSESNKYTMNFVHTRNLEYEKNNVDVVVLSFAANQSYLYDSIQVITQTDFEQNHDISAYDIVISHAPNVRNHIRFLKNYQESYRKLVMFFHGHEVMKMSKYYPKPYAYMKKKKAMQNMIQDLYDAFKLKVIRSFIQKGIKKGNTTLVFVSNWMKDVFVENTGISEGFIQDHYFVIPNSMNPIFLEETYHRSNNIKADFVTIRPLDKSKYGVDLVVELAEKNPNYTFHIYGRGNYFSYNKKPSNVEVFQTFFNPNDLAEMLKHYKCALLPTRLDAQGVMMCEIASFGMPLITSDLPICKEMLHEFSNVFYINNNELSISLEKVMAEIDRTHLSSKTKEVFSLENTIHKELAVFQKLVREN